MPFEWEDIEDQAHAIRELAKVPHDQPWSMGDLAVRLYGPAAAIVANCAGLLGDGERRAANDDGEMVAIHPKLPARRKQKSLAHEIAEWWLNEIGYQDEDRERVADHLAACLIAPRKAFKRAFWVHRFNLRRLARAFVASQTLVALRIGEVKEIPSAVVTPARVLRRDPHSVLPDDGVLRRYARGEAPHIVEVVPLSDVRCSSLVVLTSEIPYIGLPKVK